MGPLIFGNPHIGQELGTFRNCPGSKRVLLRRTRSLLWGTLPCIDGTPTRRFLGSSVCLGELYI